MDFKVFPERIKLLNSVSIPKSDFKRELLEIKAYCPNHPVWNRTMKSLRKEWAAHNLAYALGIKRDKTRDADLDYPQKWYVRFIYGIVGCIALWAIR
jgi:hypothetical protein